MGANGNSPGYPAFKYEKRSCPRFTYEATAFAEVANRRVAGDAATGFRIRTANAGEGGVMITTDQPVNVGDLLRAIFTDQPGEPLELLGRVVWTRRNSMRLLGWYTAGLAFQPGSESAARMLAGRARVATGPAVPVPSAGEEAR